MCVAHLAFESLVFASTALLLVVLLVILLAMTMLGRRGRIETDGAETRVKAVEASREFDGAAAVQQTRLACESHDASKRSKRQ